MELEVVMRTQGLRPPNLREALDSVASQTHAPAAVRLAVHTDDETAVEGVCRLVRELDGPIRSRLDVFTVEPGPRARPLNAALQRLDADYVCFLDDDDVAFPHWLSTFADGARAAPGAVVRGLAAVEWVERTPDGGHRRIGEREHPYSPRFDLVEHLGLNQSPLFTYAVPRSLVNEGLRFREDIPVLEDWAFLLAAATRADVHDTGEVVGVYHRWRSGEAAVDAVDPESWALARRTVLRDLDRRGLHLPPGSAQRIGQDERALHDARKRIERLEAELADVSAPRRGVADAAVRLPRAVARRCLRLLRRGS